jgi:hypothetical protein
MNRWMHDIKGRTMGICDIGERKRRGNSNLHHNDCIYTNWSRRRRRSRGNLCSLPCLCVCMCVFLVFVGIVLARREEGIWFDFEFEGFGRC